MSGKRPKLIGRELVDAQQLAVFTSRNVVFRSDLVVYLEAWDQFKRSLRWYVKLWRKLCRKSLTKEAEVLANVARSQSFPFDHPIHLQMTEVIMAERQPPRPVVRGNATVQVGAGPEMPR